MIDVETVGRLLKEVAAEEIMPRFRNLRDHEVREKAAGDPVTDADLAVEKRLTEALTVLLPGSTVVGEETVFDDNSVMQRLDGADPVWVIDPVDGTRNFADGSDVFCTMLGLLINGKTRAAWIYVPVNDEMVVAEEGGGAAINGQLIDRSVSREIQNMAGAVHLNYMPKGEANRIRPTLQRFARNVELYCAGITYIRLAKTDLDHALFWRAKPWDHVMGELILREVGGRTAYTDGTPYSVAHRERTGLIAVAHADAWQDVRNVLFE